MSAEDFANKILEQHWDGVTLPIPVHSFLGKFNIKVSSENLNPNMVGMDSNPMYGHIKILYEDGKASFVITNNHSNHYAQERLLIAHQLGHVALGHIGTNSDVVSDNLTYISELSDEMKTLGRLIKRGPRDIEYDANIFALNLLMPKKTLLRATEPNANGEIIKLKAIANMFGVSQNTALYRCQQMKVFLD